MKFIFYLIFVILSTANLFAQTPRLVDSKDFAVLISAECKSEPTPSITLSWEKNELATQYQIFRKFLLSDMFSSQPLATVDSLTLTYTDQNVQLGQVYEYEVRAISVGSYNSGNPTPFSFIGFGYVAAGIEIAAPDNYGWALVLVDETMMCKSCIASEVMRLQEDLRREGWGVEVISVPRADKFDKDKVKEVKNIIIDQYKNKNRNIKALYLIGRVPVPYSGDLNPDAHPDHKGAWPADIYYAYTDNEGDWSDVFVNTVVSGQREENKNIPGDGKFDVTSLSSRIANFGVGRVDFYNMKLFYDTTKTNPEMELIRNYLDKNHKYRNGEFEIKWQGLVDDNFAASSILEAFASSGWRNLASLMGTNSTKKADYIQSLKTDSYLWAYGCGGGSYQSAGGIGTSTDLSNANLNGVYSMLFGSYFGDWDSPNNFLRAPLATSPSVLTNAWAGRPHWYFHHMALNFPIGYSAMLSHNITSNYKPNVVYTSQYPNGVIYSIGMKNIHTALMGDPTLRMFAYNVPEPTNLLATVDKKGFVSLQWEHSPKVDAMKAKYNVYRSTDKFGIYTKVNNQPVDDIKFIDSTFKFDGEVYYSVRTLALETSNTASFYNTSKGIFASVVLTSVNDENISNFGINFYPNPASTSIDIELSITKSDSYKLSIFDMLGNLQAEIVDDYLNSGLLKFNYILKNAKGENLKSGVYLLQLKSGSKIISKKINILR